MMLRHAEQLVSLARGLDGHPNAGAYLVSGDTVRPIATEGLPAGLEEGLVSWLRARAAAAPAPALQDPPPAELAVLPPGVLVVPAAQDGGDLVGLIVAAWPDGGAPAGVTDPLRALGKLWAQACDGYRDPLTGLVGRSVLMDHLALALGGSRRTAAQPTLLFCDIDGLKSVNDRHGHEAGDLLLQQAAERLVSTVRPQDTVARLGGDEFVVLCPAVNDLAEAIRIAGRLRDALAVDYDVDGASVRAPASIGVALGPFPDPVTGVSQADAAMYRAKQSRCGYAVYDRDLHRNARWRMSVQTDFARALEDGQLDLYYQPQYRMSSRRIVAVEALLRWHHPERGLLGPEDFLSAAQVGHASDGLSAWVLERACTDALSWASCLPGGRCPTMAVNVSAHDLTDGGLPDLVTKVLHDTGLPGRLLQLEVTESALLVDPVDAGRQLRLLGELGVTVALDDFGTGFNSLVQLRDLPVDVLKIDRSFTRELPDNPRVAAIVAAVVRLGHRLGCRICAEGVEDTQQLRLLQGLGCDDAQGDLLHPAVPLAELPHLPWTTLPRPDREPADPHT